MLRAGLHLFVVVGLTLLTQLGGIAWLISLAFKRRLIVFLLLYTALSFSAMLIAPIYGRVALSCTSQAPLRVHAWAFCALNRQYVVPEMRDVLREAAQSVDRQFPGTQTRVLDAGFPFLDRFPLLPHLSHHDGRKADIAFFYRDASGYLPGRTRSPIGYFAFEDGPSDCPDHAISLRWDLAALQPLWPDWTLEPERMRAVLGALLSDPRVGKALIEPHLKERLGLSDPKLRFQGCRAARHDDHIHVQL